MQSLATLARARNLRRSATGARRISSFCGFGGRVAVMKLRHSDRSLIAWALYFCVLMNLFACGLGHGQMMGQQLNGIGGLFCSVDGGQSPISDKGLATPSSSNISNYFACPVCNAVTVALVFLIGLAWLLGLTQTPRVAHERRNKAPPRYSWPSANPRASPAF